MNTRELKEGLLTGKFNEQINYIYACDDSLTKSYADRYVEIIDGFFENFEYTPEDMRLFSAPGRT